jgi:pSer/pThr/pTyr-binding forkhead associated (FHA) protein
MAWDKKVDIHGKYGILVPVGGGDPIPLLKERLIIGRREGCDIVLNFANISGQHCRMTVEHGYWFVRDLGSRNGTKVDGRSVVRKRLDPNCRISFAKHEYKIDYEPQDLGAFGPPPADDDHMEELMKSSLMDRAGLERRSASSPSKNRNVTDL